MAGREFVHNPGPTNIPDSVLEAFRRPAVDFAGTSFVELVTVLWEELPELFGSDRVVVLTTVGHGAWESALLNTAEPGDTLLMAQSGLFGLRWGHIATDLGYEVVSTTIDPRRPVDVDEVYDILHADRGHRIRNVCVTHTETSTGTVSDLAAVRAAMDAADHPALLIADAVCSFGSEPIDMRQWGIDVLVVASQKGLMMPPGLSFCAVNQRAVERNRKVATPRFHLAWSPRFVMEPVYERFGGTPPEQHLYALRASLDMIAAEGGINGTIARHRRMAAAVHAAVEGWATGGPWEINAINPEHRASAVTCIRTGDLPATPLIVTARERFHVSVGVGHMEMHGSAFRMGHLGDLNEPMILGALGGLETAMTVLGMPHGDGLPAAVASLAASSAD